MVRQGSPQVEGACVFCERKNIEERLIAETAAFYFVATLGQVTDGGYTLIIPKRHVPCLGAMEEPELAEVERAMRFTAKAIDMEYGVKPAIFEHGIVGQTIPHAHLHLMPARISLGERVLRDFPDTGIAIFTSFKVLHRLHAETGKKYLFWSVPERPWMPNGGRHVFESVWDPPAPAQYLRTAAAELMGRPERANWRNMDPALDKELWSSTVERLAPHFWKFW